MVQKIRAVMEASCIHLSLVIWKVCRVTKEYSRTGDLSEALDLCDANDRVIKGRQHRPFAHGSEGDSEIALCFCRLSRVGDMLFAYV